MEVETVQLGFYSDAPSSSTPGSFYKVAGNLKFPSLPYSGCQSVLGQEPQIATDSCAASVW